jgi:adenosine deaminase CECR1
VADVRQLVDDFDRQLLQRLILGPEDANAPNIWVEFSACFERLGNVLNYQPVFLDYFVDAFETLAADGIDHVDMRIDLNPLFDFQGHKWSGMALVDEYLKARDLVRKTYPDFNLRLIVAGSRDDPIATVWGQLLAMIPLRLGRPDIVVGYDLVGEEDGGNPTAYYVGIFTLAKLVYKCLFRVDLALYLHDGESNWREDRNLRSAFGLACHRVGHGLNLHFFPALERHFIARPTPLEVCPVSNQMLRYVADLRLHPAEGYLSRGVTCVLSSDDPAIFGDEGLSYDFWEATMSWRLGLAELKRLILNSIEYSALPPGEKDRLRSCWEAKWDDFIRELGR